MPGCNQTALKEVRGSGSRRIPCPTERNVRVLKCYKEATAIRIKIVCYLNIMRCYVLVIINKRVVVRQAFSNRMSKCGLKRRVRPTWEYQSSPGEMRTYVSNRNPGNASQRSSLNSEPTRCSNDGKNAVPSCEPSTIVNSSRSADASVEE